MRWVKCVTVVIFKLAHITKVEDLNESKGIKVESKTTMETVRVVSTITVKASSETNSVEKIDLTPWDLQFLQIGTIQRGLLFLNQDKNRASQIRHLQHSLSSALAFFPLLSGRLVIFRHPDNTVSSHIVCDHKGVPFVHAVAPNTAVAHIVQPNYVPSVVRAMFPLNGVKNHQGQPLLAVQVTELLDGVFIALTINHVVADGKSLWRFVNSWAQISHSGDGSLKPSAVPERFFLETVHRPIRFLFTKQQHQIQSPSPSPSPTLVVPIMRVFHFTKQKITELKAKARTEAGYDKISSLQALVSHVWRCVIGCCRHIEEHEEVVCMLPVGVRARMVPALPEDYFGNAAVIGGVGMKAGELVGKGGLGKGALEMNKMIGLHTCEKLKREYEGWVRSPRLVALPCGGGGDGRLLAVGSSPRFDVYGNDFGWGKPVAVRSGGEVNGMVSLFAGVEEGSVDVEVTLAYEILEALGNELHFVHAC
ncbi:hypothetical protein VNO78_26927 [Psophocarpus tetragonolobus]|uniref:Uncharacterized protein n=1 Tax=Psophocarpus tetragonolobus TaxID=3891 RepID=A0AAN9XBB5_PSOTE